MAISSTSSRPGPRRPLAALVACLVLVTTALAACSSGGDSAAGEGDSAAFESERTRPTDQAEHDHSGEASALAPETVLPERIAELGPGVPAGGSEDLWMGLNICGRFVELPAGIGSAAGGAASDFMSIDETGLLTISPGPGDPNGHDVTVAAVAEMLDVDLSTGRLELGPSWEGQVLGEGDSALPLGGASFVTGDQCALGPDVEQAEVQLWYYTPLAVASGEQVRMVVTDPQDTPLLEGGSAVTLAFAPVSSLPTLPPAALLG